MILPSWVRSTASGPDWVGRRFASQMPPEGVGAAAAQGNSHSRSESVAGVLVGPANGAGSVGLRQPPSPLLAKSAALAETAPPERHFSHWLALLGQARTFAPPSCPPRR